MPRTPGRYGRRPPKNAPALELGPLLTGVIPAHPIAADYLAALNGGWQILDNDQYGTCAPVTWANIRRLITATLTPPGYYPSLDEVITLYKTQNPGFPAQDDGCDIQAMLEYLVATGGPDGVKALAFAKVNASDPDEVKAAIAIFGYVWTGINVLACNMTEFAASQPWDYQPGSAPDGGHSVVTAGYGTPGPGPLGGDERFITWAEETSFSDTYWARQVEECWAVIWPEHLGSRAFLEGVNLAQLAADYLSITGRPFPAPVPPPPPAPVPPPAPADLLHQLAAQVRAIAAAGDRHLNGVVAWLHSHGLLCPGCWLSCGLSPPPYM